MISGFIVVAILELPAAPIYTVGFAVVFLGGTGAGVGRPWKTRAERPSVNLAPAALA